MPRRIGPRRGLDDRRIGLPGGAEGAQEERAGRDRQQDCSGKENVLPHGCWYERNAVTMRQLLVFLEIGRASNDASGHRPVVDAELQNEEHVNPDETSEEQRHHEHVQREEPRQRGGGDDRTSEQ